MTYEYLCKWCLKTENSLDDDILKEEGLKIDDLLSNALCLDCYNNNNKMLGIKKYGVVSIKESGELGRYYKEYDTIEDANRAIEIDKTIFTKRKLVIVEVKRVVKGDKLKK